MKTTDTKQAVECDHCSWKGDLSELGDIDYEQLADDIVAAGACPKCHCGAFIEPSRWLNRTPVREAAPELLEACKQALLFEGITEHPAISATLREAIARAEGGAK